MGAGLIFFTRGKQGEEKARTRRKANFVPLPHVHGGEEEKGYLYMCTYMHDISMGDYICNAVGRMKQEEKEGGEVWNERPKVPMRSNVAGFNAWWDCLTPVYIPDDALMFEA